MSQRRKIITWSGLGVLFAIFFGIMTWKLGLKETAIIWGGCILLVFLLSSLIHWIGQLRAKNKAQ